MTVGGVGDGPAVRGVLRVATRCPADQNSVTLDLDALCC
jgi:hypothetical protein